jgi:phenylacetate-coenzyme A ligase PaaK-like adenylate-forming protein
MLRQLCFAAEAGELHIAPALISSSAEQLLPETRAALEQTFRAPVFDAWACVEAGLLGHSCPKGPGIHLIDDLSIVEPVDANGAPVGAGMLSAGILLTNLFNSLLPIIRYSISDTVTLLDRAIPCVCGSQSRTISGIGGRSDQMFIYPGGRYVQPYVFDFLLSTEPSIIEYQVHQTPNGARILVRAAAAFDHQGLARKIAEALVPQGLHEPEIVIELASEIARGATGKLIRYVPMKT